MRKVTMLCLFTGTIHYTVRTESLALFFSLSLSEVIERLIFIFLKNSVEEIKCTRLLHSNENSLNSFTAVKCFCIHQVEGYWSRKCGSLDVSQSYWPLQPVKGTVFFLFVLLKLASKFSFCILKLAAGGLLLGLFFGYL
jgi:hypothetical protein